MSTGPLESAAELETEADRLDKTPAGQQREIELSVAGHGMHETRSCGLV
jgi:hypothetical protein